jgi:hypothetical protein
VAVAAVQRKIKATAAASISIGAGDGWATPTAGNLLVVSANSDATVTIGGSGWTPGPSIIDGNGAYSWYKFAAGTETTITASPSVSADIVISACEYSGVAAFDAQNSSTIAGSNGTVITAAAVTTSATGDLIVAFALLHSAVVISAFPTSPSWSAGFTQQLIGDSPATGGSHCTTLVGELLGAGAAGSYSTVASWTNQMADRQHIILAFTASGGGPVTGAAALAITATLAAGAARTAVAASALAVTATTSAGAIAVRPAQAATPATVTLSAGAARTALPSASLAATATLAAGAASTKPSTAALAVTATLASSADTGAAPIIAAAALAVTATLSTGATRAVTGGASLAATAILTAGGTRTAAAASALAVTAALAAGAGQARTAAAAMSAVATLTASATSGGKITYRPNAGTTARPYAGITLRL